MTRIGLRAGVLAVLGVLLCLVSWWLWSLVPEMTIDNFEDLIDNPEYRFVSRLWWLPSALALVCLVSTLWLSWRRARIAAVMSEYPDAVVIEVEVPKHYKDELERASVAKSTAWSHGLVLREGVVSLYTGLPPRPEIVVDAHAVRRLEYDPAFREELPTPGAIVLEWYDESAEVDRRLVLRPIGGGLLGQTAPRWAHTSDAVSRGRELVGLPDVPGDRSRSRVS